MSTLYTLSAELAGLMDALEESGGEMTPEVEAALEAIQGELADKIDALAKLTREFLARSEARKAEAQRLRDAAAMDQRAADRLKAYLGDCLRLAGLRKASGVLFGVSLCRNSAPSIEVADPGLLPAAWQRVTVDADKEAIRAAWKAGEPLPAGVVVTVGEHVRIS